VNLTGEADTFFRNDGELFSDRTPLVGLAAASRPFTRFGMGFVDFDNDGRVDLFQANGRVTRPGNEAGSRPYDQPNLVFRGAESGRFHEVEPRGGTAQLLVRTSRAAAFGDLDGDGGDGGVDVVVVNRDGPLHVLRNRVGSGRWVALRLRERSGRAALGARVSLRLGERTITRHARSAYSYCAANDPTVHVGLGAATVARDVRVTWADGVAESFGDLAADGVHELVRGRGR
jgi:hypothetical protein